MPGMLRMLMMAETVMAAVVQNSKMVAIKVTVHIHLVKKYTHMNQLIQLPQENAQ